MHSSNLTFVIALLASPLALLPLASHSAAGQPLLAADQTVGSSTLGGRPLVDAPLSTLGPARLPPVDRAAQPGTHSDSAGPVNGTPFSATPSGTLSEGGTQPDQHDRSFAASNDTGVVPNLGK